MTRVVTYIEVDVPYCALNYGVSPCTAALGVTGDAKCFNSLSTCQDRVNFSNDPVTLRFADPTADLDPTIEAIPSISAVSITPALVSLGKDLGQRGSVSVTFGDHFHSDTGPGGDKYVTERAYTPYRQGTFWGKFRARQQFIKGRPLRLIRGEVGQALAEMETHHYVIDSFNGPTPTGSFTITARDALKLADGDRAQAPLASNGFLISAINAVTTSATLSPTGIGDLEYPVAGYVAIGGEEICAFTRSGDALTLTRGQLGTTAVEHEAQDRVQLCLRYDGDDPADIIFDLLVNYANIDSDWINLQDWQNETSAFLGRVYSATIADPVSVKKLVDEIIEQAALAMWWDDQAQRIRLKVLRAIATDAVLYSEDNIIAGSLSISEQPAERVSQAWTWYGQRNPLRPVDEVDNYRSALATVNLQAETDEGQPAIRKVMSRWIAAFGRDTAERLNNLILGRFETAPRRFMFSVSRVQTAMPVLGGGARISSYSLQDATGAADIVPIQIVKVAAEADRFRVEAEEMSFEALDPLDLENRTIVIDANVEDVNLRDLHDSIYPEPDAGSPSITLTVIIQSGTIVGSTSNTTPAFDVGDWSGTGIVPVIRLFGRIEGKGGNGGDGREGQNNNGQDGGAALYTRTAAILELGADAEIWGGGGGGGGWYSEDEDGNETASSGGGGGAGQLPGSGGLGTNPGETGTMEAGGAGPTEDPKSADGGDPGEAGEPVIISFVPVAAGGAAGAAIDGLSFLTISGTGDRRGPEVN